MTKDFKNEHEHEHEHNHECDCEELDWIELVDDDGETHRFIVDSLLDLDDKRYAILLPEDQMEEEEPEFIVLRVENDANGQEVLVDLEDDDEFARVCEALDQLEESQDEDKEE